MKKAFLSAILCAALLGGCGRVGPPMAVPNALLERIELSSVTKVSAQKIVNKLFPLEKGFVSALKYGALADEGARKALGQGLEALDRAEPLLAFACDHAVELRRDVTKEDMAAEPEALIPLLSAYKGDAKEGFSRIADGRIFVSSAVYEAWAKALLGKAPLELPGLTYDQGNDGFLFEDEEKTVRAYVLRAAFMDGEEIGLDFSVEERGASLGDAVVYVRVDESSPFGLAFVRAAYDDERQAEKLSFFGFSGAALALDTELPLGGLGLTIRTGEGLFVTPTDGGLRLSVLPDGTKVVLKGEARIPEPKAQLMVLAEKDAGYRAEDSARASAQAAAQGYAGQGLELWNLQIQKTYFLGREDAYLLRYTAVDEAGRAVESVEHYVLGGGNGGFYHFVFRYFEGVDPYEQERLNQAAAAIGFIPYG